MKEMKNMKRIAIFLTALAIVATGCSKGQKFTLQGNLESAKFNSRTDSLLLQSDAFPTLISIQLKDGQFSYKGRVEKPAAATLKGVGGPIVSRYLILEKGDITFQDGLPCGTPLNDAYAELSRSLQAIVKENSSDRKAVYTAAGETLRAYLKEHGNDASAVPALMLARRFTREETLAELIDMASKEVQNDGSIHWIKQQLKKKKSQPAPVE